MTADTKKSLPRSGALLSSSEVVINNILMIALGLIVVYFAFATPVFFSFSNFRILLTNYSIIGVVVSVMTILLIAGQIDLSVGSNVAFSGMIASLCLLHLEFNPVMAMLAGVLAGAAAGALNGFLCGILKFNSIIVTLGMLSVLRGATLLVNQTEIYGLGDTFFYLGNGEIFGIPILLCIALAAFALVAAFLSFTVSGRHVFAIGVNPQAAHLAALPVKKLIFLLYVATGAAAGLAGVLLAARLDGVSPGSFGLQMELQALTIILLGGVAFTGGRGRVSGVVTAWVFLGVLENGLTLLNVPPFIQLVASGLALVFAASIDALGTFLGPRLARKKQVSQQLAAAKRDEH